MSCRNKSDVFRVTLQYNIQASRVTMDIDDVKISIKSVC